MPPETDYQSEASPEAFSGAPAAAAPFADEMSPRPERRRAAWVLAAFAAVAAVAAAAIFFSGKVTAVAAKAEDVASQATTSVVDFARRLVAPAPSLDGGRISAAYPLPKTGKAVVANLSEMRLYLFEDGAATSSFDILSRGRPGTAWETPPGAYAVKSKEKQHYSSIGHVWMPDSMQFQGNFFIHGWPYYDSGADVPKGYSGGCIRMATADAAQVYAFAEVGTPVIVLGGDQDALGAAPAGIALASSSTAATGGRYELDPDAPAFPKLRAKSFVVGDLDTGDVFARRDDETPRPIASVTKLMAAAVDLEILNQYQDVQVSKEAVATEESYGNLRVGETLSVGDLLYPLLLESSNDAAEQLAETAGRGYFLRSMNEKAASIGLASSHFDDPAGLSPKTVSTAADLFKLAQYIHRYKGFIFKTSLVKTYALGKHTWVNSSKMLGDPDYQGGKHGYIPESGKTLVATFGLRLSEFDTRNVAVTLLNSSDPHADAEAAKKYLEKWVVWVPDSAAAVASAATSSAAL